MSQVVIITYAGVRDKDQSDPCVVLALIETEKVGVLTHEELQEEINSGEPMTYFEWTPKESRQFMQNLENATRRIEEVIKERGRTS